MSYFGKFYLTGPDAQKAADWIFSGNMQKNPGSVVYTCMLNERGGAEADLTVVSNCFITFTYSVLLLRA